MMEKRRFAVLLCAEESDYVKKKYGGYFGVFVRMLAEEGEIWDVYSVAAGEFPHDDDLAAYDGFVITGSCNDAHGNDAWICELLNLLTKLDSMKKKVLGICFGHQSRKEGRGKFSRSDPDHHSIIPTRTTPLDLNEEYVEEGDVDGEGVQEQAYQYEGELNQAEEESGISSMFGGRSSCSSSRSSVSVRPPGFDLNRAAPAMQERNDVESSSESSEEEVEEVSMTSPPHPTEEYSTIPTSINIPVIDYTVPPPDLMTGYHPTISTNPSDDFWREFMDITGTVNAPATYDSGIGGSQVPTMFYLGVGCSQDPAVYYSGVGTSHVPFVYNSGVGTSQVPPPYFSGAETSHGPSTYFSDAGTSQVTPAYYDHPAQPSVGGSHHEPARSQGSGERGERAGRGNEEEDDGGPADKSLLVSFHNHIARDVWKNEQPHKVLRCHCRCTSIDFCNQNNRLTPGQPWFNLAQQSGLTRLQNLSFKETDEALVSAFIERWHPETNSFHFPWGEMTITLHDVLHITGLPINGIAMSKDLSHLDDNQLRIRISQMFGLELAEVSR